MSETNNFILKKVEKFLQPDYTFFIPSYQRGYRWDKQQVQELLDDIEEAMLAGKKEYCLQPVVLKTLEKDKRFEVIDGQQRLTTIYLLFLNLMPDAASLFKLEYETRENCLDFFTQLKEKNYNYDNPDFAHISTAYDEIDKWVISKHLGGAHLTNKFTIALAELLEVIWYELPKKEYDDHKDSVKIFTRLNVGKIPLTSAELIKALFLSSDNLNVSTDKESIQYPKDRESRQIELASDWTQMEYAFQDEAFWNFINKGANEASTRIDFIFELVARDHEAKLEGENDVFRFFYKRFEQAKAQGNVNGMLLQKDWEELKSCFMTLKEWHKKTEHYHRIGYLIWAGVDILTIYRLSRTSTKSEFIEMLNRQIKKTLGNIDIKKLSYQEPQAVTKVMVLFNAMIADQSQDKSLRFPFELLKLKDNHWSLEHIHAQNSVDIKQKDYVEWMNDHKSVLEKLKEDDDTKDLILRIAGFDALAKSKDNGSDLSSQFEQLSEKIIKFLSKPDQQGDLSNEDYKRFTDKDHISNMALLDGKSNSSLGNRAFAVKRERILSKEREGTFIPQATKNVFLKYYSNYPDHLIYWTIKDRQTYLSRIVELINPFIKN
ncbi:DUF262 domain-containing protein [Pedobacter gandavensis]|uniref:DUF262 domain-containing protein n=1 Tax=Pedobacter gandavensis TaxID=2679963 RepID=UPI0029308C67|nr:DUF262 domain-containing protein [Pedobacter gandavensis]